MKRLLSILLYSMTLISIGCTNEDDATVVAIFGTPSSYVVNCGDKVYIDVTVTTLNNTLTDICVTAFDPEHGKDEIVSIKPGTKEYRERIIWEVPSMTKDTTFIDILISATDNENVSNDFQLKLTAIGGDTALLPEKSGITLYSSMSGKQDAFSFITQQPLFSSSDAEDCDLVFSMSSEDGSDMAPTWSTKTDLVFCRANSFDYSSATWGNVHAVFNSSIRTDAVSDLQIDDIILIGREIHAEDNVKVNAIGVCRIMAIYDENGTQNDRIIFNLKSTL